jgi:ankyrin repeat protein
MCIKKRCHLFLVLPSESVAQMFQNPTEEMITKLAASIQSLFIDNDYSPFLRLSRSFLKKSPELIHNAIINNHTDLLLKFIPIASINILQQRNQLGETVLLHAARLNRTEIMKALLERNNADILLEDIDAKDNNIFHIIALNSTSSDILDLVIHHLLGKSIKIQDKFDQSNQDHFTPLQLAITKNNLLVTKSFFKHFNTNVYQTENFTGDNLIHLAVRYGDLTMVKYLIEEGKLIEQSKQSNLQMTPSELAQSLKRDDIIQYFNEIYPQREIDENDSSDED